MVLSRDSTVWLVLYKGQSTVEWTVCSSGTGGEVGGVRVHWGGDSVLDQGDGSGVEES